MDAPRKADVLLLADEKFDFNLSLSSSSANDDDDVFLGPAGNKERGPPDGAELRDHLARGPLSPGPESRCPWSPLTGERFAEVSKEAHWLALQIEGHSRSTAPDAERPGAPADQDVETFVQESKLKTNIFEKGSEAKKSPLSLKRETYFLSESPLMGPPSSGPPAPDLRSGCARTSQGAPAQASLHQTQQPRPCARPSAVEPCAGHPLSQARTQKRLVSRLQPPRASSVRGRSVFSATEKPRKELPASPPRTKLPSEEEAHREVLAEKSRVVPDAVTVPAGKSHLAPGKRALPVPNKLGLKRTLVKAPGRTGSLARKSSSSGSVPGTSPAGTQAKSGELENAPANGSWAVSSRNLSRLKPAAQQPPRQSGPADAACKPTKSAGIDAVTAEQPPGPSSASFTYPRTPESAGPRLDSTFSVPRSSQSNKMGHTRKHDSSLNSKTKIVPTPTNPFKIPKFSIGESPVCATPQRSRAQRPQSCTSAGRVVHSTPIRHSSVAAPQSLLPSPGTPVSTTHVPAVPTPASRRLSGLPLMTPRTMPRALPSPWCASARRLSSEPRKTSGARKAPTVLSGGQTAATRPSDASPDGSLSPPSTVPQALQFSPEKRDSTFLKNTTTEAILPEAKTTENPALNEVQDKQTSLGHLCSPTSVGVGLSPLSEAILVDIQLGQLAITPKAESRPPADLPLIDFGSTPEAGGGQLPLNAPAALGSESRPLIDLMSNTPDLNKDVPLKPLHITGQLIDLASPLIQLSPAADKENVKSPLLRF